jgi:hypothetical protein
MKLTVILAVCFLFVLLPTDGWAQSDDTVNEMPDEVIDFADVAAEPINTDGLRNPRTVGEIYKF